MKANVDDPVVRSLRTKNLLGKGGIGLGFGVIACSFFVEGPLPVIKVAGGVIAAGGAATQISAYVQFYLQVENGARWDVKDQIAWELGPGVMLCSLGSCNTAVEYTVPGNIFFGYIGRASGFTAWELQAGAAWAEYWDEAHDKDKPDEYTGPYQGKFQPRLSRPGFWNWGDEPKDHIAVTLGILLWDRYEENLSLGQFKTMLGSKMSQLAHRVPWTKPIEESVARKWPYSVGYFNNRGNVFTPP
jgi:hypothetical protein